MSFDDLPPQTPINPNADAYAVTCLERSKAAADAGRTVLDVAYGPDYWQKIDIYLPKDPADEPLPVLLFFHGGNFTHGYKEWCGFMAPTITAFPAIFVSGSYRLAPTASYRAIMEDAFAAFSWLREHIAEHGGDPTRMFIGGHSAGAIHETVSHINLPVWWHALRRHADGMPDPETGEMRGISTVYRIWAQPAFVSTPDGKALVREAPSFAEAGVATRQ